MFDKIKPGIVEWKKVTKTFSGPSSKIKKIENCNHVIECGHKLDLKLIGIDGNDIHTENKTFCLGSFLASKILQLPWHNSLDNLKIASI